MNFIIFCLVLGIVLERYYGLYIHIHTYTFSGVARERRALGRNHKMPNQVKILNI